MSIDGSGDVFPIGECDNASRVIKYVMLLGYKYSHYNLVDMRIHDINVVADLNAHDPNAPSPDEPVEYDGTETGATEPIITESHAKATYSVALSQIAVYWTGPWPQLHLVWSLNANRFAIAFDLLGSTTIHALYFDYLDDNTIEELVNFIIIESIFALNLALFAWMTAAFEKSTLSGPAATLFFIGWMATLIALLFWPLMVIDYWISTGFRTAGWATAVFLILAVTCFVAGLGLSFSAISDPTTFGVTAALGATTQSAQAASSSTLICRVFMFALAAYYFVVASDMQSFLPSLR